MLTLADVIEAISGFRPAGADQDLTGAVADSYQAFPGCLFFALPSVLHDRHAEIQDAFERGAQLAVIQQDTPLDYPVIDLRPKEMLRTLMSVQTPCCLRVDDSLSALQAIARFWRRKLDLRVIAITGSIGKSTTKELVAQVLDRRYQTLKNPGSLNNPIGLPLSVLGLNEDHDLAVFEMSFDRPGEVTFLCDLVLPQVGVITNIGIADTEQDRSQEEVARGKAELVQALPAAPEGVAVLNMDDPIVRHMAAFTQAKVFYYGLDPQANLWADHVEGLGLEGIRFRLHYRKESIYLHVPLIGRHSVHTALRAAAIGLIEGLTWQEIVDGLQSEGTQVRLSIVRSKLGALILDDTYNASPESMLAALNLLNEMEGHKVAVLGDMLELGPYERSGHELVGVRAAEVVDELITIGARAQWIAEAASQAGLPPNQIKVMEDPQQVIETLEKELCAEDIVLVKGSYGMHMDQIVARLEASG